jgi:hypothetical protein
VTESGGDLGVLWVVLAIVTAAAAVGSFGLAAEKRYREGREIRARQPARASRDRDRFGAAGKNRLSELRFVAIGGIFSVAAAVFFYLHSGTTHRRPRPVPPTPTHTKTVAHHSRKPVRESARGTHDSCLRSGGVTPDNCRKKARGLHPNWGEPEWALYKFLTKDRHLGPAPCVKSTNIPSLASGGLACTVRHRTVYFLRFSNSGRATHYLTALRNKEAVPTSVGSCNGKSPAWEVEGVVQGQLAFLSRHHKFLAVWGYSGSGSRNVGLLRGPRRDAAQICAYWFQEAF